MEHVRAQAEALIAEYVEPHPTRPGQSEWWLKERGVPVWVVIGSIVLSENPDEHPEVLDDERAAAALGDTRLVKLVTDNYGLSDEAMEAAIAYYWHNKRQVDARLIINAAR